MRAAAEQFARDAGVLHTALLGREGRPFMHARLSPEERQMRHQMLTEQRDPAAWGAVLETVGQDRVSRLREVRRWAKLNQTTTAAAGETEHGR